MDKRTAHFRKLIRKINWYAPYLGAGIQVSSVSDDLTRFEIKMPLRWYNKNLFGTHFGGSLYSMCDPFFTFILIIHLGGEYIVWDKSASIEFVRPGTGTVTAVMEISKTEIESLRQRVEEIGKLVENFNCNVVDESGQVVARLTKGVYVRKKGKE